MMWMVRTGAQWRHLIEQTNEIVRRLNRQTGKSVLPEARALDPCHRPTARRGWQGEDEQVPGQRDPLSATDKEIEDAVNRMYTDPDHLRLSDPGRVEGNIVFVYLDAFEADRDAVADLKNHYHRGGLGDMVLKRRLTSILQTLLAPIRERRLSFAQDQDFVMDVPQAGAARGTKITEATKLELREALGTFRFDGES
jgi:tryptophanyl-tRNA synthetase